MIPYVWMVSRVVAEDLEAALQPHIRDKYGVMRTRQNLQYRKQSKIEFEGKPMTAEQLEEAASYLLYDAFCRQFRMDIYAKGTTPAEISKRTQILGSIFQGKGGEETRAQSIQQLERKSKEH